MWLYKCQTLDVTSHRHVLVFICMLTIFYYWPQLSQGCSLQYILNVCVEEVQSTNVHKCQKVSQYSVWTQI